MVCLDEHSSCCVCEYEKKNNGEGRMIVNGRDFCNGFIGCFRQPIIWYICTFGNKKCVFLESRAINYSRFIFQNCRIHSTFVNTETSGRSVRSTPRFIQISALFFTNPLVNSLPERISPTRASINIQFLTQANDIPSQFYVLSKKSLTAQRNLPLEFQNRLIYEKAE